MTQREELAFLRSLTPSKQTEETISRAAVLHNAIIEEVRQGLDYNLEWLSSLLPRKETCYEILRQAASIRLPEDPSVLACVASGLLITITNIRVDVAVLLSAVDAALNRINTVVDRARSYWQTESPTEEKWKADSEFTVYASDLIDLQTNARIMHEDCDRIYWMLSNMNDAMKELR